MPSERAETAIKDSFRLIVKEWSENLDAADGSFGFYGANITLGDAEALVTKLLAARDAELSSLRTAVAHGQEEIERLTMIITGLQPGKTYAANAEIARVLGWTPCFSLHDDAIRWREPDGRTLHGVLPDFLGDDAVALRWCVPFIHARGYEISVDVMRDGTTHVYAYTANAEGSQGHTDGDHALARALCQVVDTLGKEQGDG